MEGDLLDCLARHALCRVFHEPKQFGNLEGLIFGSSSSFCRLLQGGFWDSGLKNLRVLGCGTMGPDFGDSRGAILRSKGGIFTQFS